MSLVSATDKAGNALSGLYGFVVDKGSASEEFMLGTVSGTTVTITARGLDPQDGKTEVSGLKKAHRRGATVEQTDYPVLAILARFLNGDEALPNPMQYAPGVGPVSGSDLADKEYVDSVAISGAGLASTADAGLAEEATQAEIEADTAAGSAGRLFVNPSTLVTSKYGTRLPSSDEKDALAAPTSPSATNKFITQADLQKAAEIYAADSVGTDAYAITLSPAPAAYATGMVIHFKAGTANTGAATLNVNSLGAKTLKKYVSGGKSDLETGDILANQPVTVIYDGTDMVVLSRLASETTVHASGQAQKSESEASTTQTIAHGLGRVPKYVRIKAVGVKTVSTGFSVWAEAIFNGSVQTSQSFNDLGSGSYAVSEADFRLSSVGTSGTNAQTGVISVDATNITITWTKHGTPGSITWEMIWEASA